MYWDLEDEDSVSEIAALKQQLEAEKSEKLEWMSNSAKASAELEAERARVAKSDKAIELFGSWLDWWSIANSRQISDVYGAWGRVLEEFEIADKPASGVKP